MSELNYEDLLYWMGATMVMLGTFIIIGYGTVLFICSVYRMLRK